jgi:hypothetical protein
MLRVGACIAACLMTGLLSAQDPPVSVLVTAEAQKSAPEPHLTGNDVLVRQKKENLPVTALEPVGRRQLWVLIDDGTDSSISLQFKAIRNFMMNQPDTTQIGVGYMRNGSVQVIQPLTADHSKAGQALRIPTGPPGISASPYIALTDLIHKWSAEGQAREVLMISSGIDPDYGPGPEDVYLSTAIDTAQRAGIIVYSIYYSGAGHFGHSYFQIYWGQYDLAKISDETGGEFYWQGNINPVDLTPYLDDLSHRLNEQYLLTFQAKAQNKPGFQNFKFSSEVPHVSLVGPAKVYVPGI